MYGYNVIAIREDRATLRSDPSAPIAAYSIGRYPLWRRPFNQIYAGANNAINPFLSYRKSANFF
jgi:hypothetical protein